MPPELPPEEPELDPEDEDVDVDEEALSEQADAATRESDTTRESPRSVRICTSAYVEAGDLVLFSLVHFGPKRVIHC